MSINERLERIENLVLIQAKEVLNVNDLTILLNLSRSRIYHLISAREIPHYKKGRLVFFKKAEIEEWLLQDRILTNQELEDKAATYVSLNK